MPSVHTAVDDLPEDVLLIIFSKLTFPERKTVRLVSKHWLQVCSSASVTKHELVKLKSEDLQMFKTPRGCLNLEIVCRNFTSTVLKQQNRFFLKHGHSVKYLKVKFLGYHYQVTHQIINHCCNAELITLEFLLDYDYNEIVCGSKYVKDVCAKLGCLLSLTLTGIIPSAIFTDPAFCRLTDNIPNLTHLVLTFLLLEDTLSAEKSIMTLIVKQAFTLTELVLNSELTTDTFLDNVCEEIGPQLVGLYVKGRQLKSFDSLTKHADKLRNLKKLELSFMNWDKDEGNSLRGLVRFSELEFISFAESSFHDEDFIHLVGLVNLKGLDISGTECTAAGILKFFGKKALPNLIALKMKAMGSCITDNILASILPNLPNLEYLDLSQCRQIGTRGAQAIMTNCQQLTHLSLLGCNKIRNVLEPVRLDSLKHLVYLELSHCQSLDILSVLKLQFDNLEILELTHLGPNKEEVKELFKVWPNLKHVFLYSCVLERLGNVDIVEKEFRHSLPFTIFDFNSVNKLRYL